MANLNAVHMDFSESDLDFLISVVVPGSLDPDLIKRAIRNDPGYRKSIVSDIRVFNHVNLDDLAFLKISPYLYFEILIRRMHKDIGAIPYTVEQLGRDNIPVFDSRKVVKLLDVPMIPEYLAHLLASFTKIESSVQLVRVRKGVYKRTHLNNMDMDGLITLASSANEMEKFGYYKRIGDVCLFITGLFRDYIARYAPTDRKGKPVWLRRMHRSLDEYVSEGRRFYGLAGEHPASDIEGLREVFATLKDNFTSACKPLAFLGANYFHLKTGKLFAVPAFR